MGETRIEFPLSYKGGTGMKNKGFSLVELIIVIAIMTILAGALAPALIKYINKSRLSVDIDTGSEIARTIMVAVTNDNAFNAAKDHNKPINVNDMDDPDFKKEVFQSLGKSSFKGNSKKDAQGNSLDQNFYYTLDYNRNKVQVYYGGTDADHMVYPTLGSKLNLD